LKRYLVESNHSAEECVHAIELVLAHGFITHYDWGCEDGVHTGWAEIEADSKQEAMLSVPTALRPKARVVEIKKFTPEMIDIFHSKDKE
jgi:hypothetical protein